MITEDQSPNKTGVITLMKKMVNKEKDIFAITEIGLREEIIIIIILLKGADAVIGSFGYSEKRNRIVDYTLRQ